MNKILSKIVTTIDSSLEWFKKQISFLFRMIIWVIVFYFLTALFAWLFTKFFNINVAFNDFILLITAAFIFIYTKETQELKEQSKRQAEATEKMAEYQLMPTVDVNMIYEKSLRKTYFWFSNASSIPAFVLIKFNINKTEKEGKIGPLRIAPYHPHYPQIKKTATSFDFLEENSADEINVVLNITVTPALNDGPIKFNFTKSYRFDKSELRWNETSWSYPDPPFPKLVK